MKSQFAARLLRFVAVVVIAHCVSGCMTSAVMEKVKPTTGGTFDKKTRKEVFPPGKPGYGVLLPAAFAADVVTAPLWFPFIMIFARNICG